MTTPLDLPALRAVAERAERYARWLSLDGVSVSVPNPEDWDGDFYDATGVAADLRALSEGVRALMEDAARLDWLERHTASVACNYSAPDAWQVDVDAPDFGSVTVYVGKDIREAIDAARTTPPDQERTDAS